MRIYRTGFFSSVLFQLYHIRVEHVRQIFQRITGGRSVQNGSRLHDLTMMKVIL